VLSRQRLDRGIPDKETSIEKVAAWQCDRNKRHTKADWQFTTADARASGGQSARTHALPHQPAA
jgi:hypothetical protein